MNQADIKLVVVGKILTTPYTQEFRCRADWSNEMLRGIRVTALCYRGSTKGAIAFALLPFELLTF